MKKISLTFTLILTLMFPSISSADWLKIAEGVDGTTFHVIPDDIRKKNEFVFAWVLFDYLTPTPLGHFSVEDYMEFDCKRLRTKSHNRKWYFEPMASGASELDTNRGDWRTVTEGSVERGLMRYVCFWAETQLK